MDIQGQVVHVGVNYVLAPWPGMKESDKFEFPKTLNDAGVLVTEIKQEGQVLLLARRTNNPIEIRIGALGPQVGQLLMIAPELGGRSLDGVGMDMKDIADCFMKFWPNLQILTCDVALRQLHKTSCEHAFQELWENRLKQSKESLKIFGRQVWGGGLRLVLPPHEEEINGPTIDIKIESYINDPKMIYIETLGFWNQKFPVGQVIDPDVRVEFIENYTKEKVVQFMQED
jgi:hypothetical protein